MFVLVFLTYSLMLLNYDLLFANSFQSLSCDITLMFIINELQTQPVFAHLTWPSSQLFILVRFKAMIAIKIIWMTDHNLASTNDRKLVLISNMFGDELSKNRAQQANDASFGILSTLSTLSIFNTSNTLITSSKSGNVTVGLLWWISSRKLPIFRCIIRPSVAPSVGRSVKYFFQFRKWEIKLRKRSKGRIQ